MEKIARTRSGEAATAKDEPADDSGMAPAPEGGEANPDGQPVGRDNIREGKVRGVMGGPNQSQGSGQGG